MNFFEDVDINELEKEEAEPTFSYKEAAEILDVNPSTVSHAVSREEMETKNVGGGRDRIPASQIVKYGIRRGQDSKELRDKIKSRTGASNDQFIKWIIIGLGLVWLFKEFSDG